MGNSNKAICLSLVEWLLTSSIAEGIFVGWIPFLICLMKYKDVKKLDYKERVLKKNHLQQSWNTKMLRSVYCDKNPIIFFEMKEYIPYLSQL